MAEKFSLADVLAGVPDSGTNQPRDQIEYIDLDRLESDPNNFYEISGVAELASNIQIFGLQQPIRIRGAADGRFVIVSGHRRRAAIQYLVDEGFESFRQVPCIRERMDGSPAFQELRLIFANSDTRKLTAAEIAKQAERVEMLLYQLKEEGHEFPGRMRDHVAEACKVSKSKLARLKVIRDNLSADFKAAFESNALPEQTAYILAQFPLEFQRRLFRVSSVKDLNGSRLERVQDLYNSGTRWDMEMACPDGKACKHGDAALRHDLDNYDPCKGATCCLTCPAATRDWSPCERMCSKAKAQRAAAKKEKDEKEAAEIAKRTNLHQKKTIANAQRLLRAIDAAGVSDRVTIQWEDSSYSVADIRAWAAGEFKDGERWWDEKLRPAKCQHPVDIARKLGCSSDFVLGLSDDLTPGGSGPAATGGVAWYPAVIEPRPGTEVVVIDDLGCADNGKFFSSDSFDGSVLWKEVVMWTPAPGADALETPLAVPPADGWVPLQWLPGSKPPDFPCSAVTRFTVPGLDKDMIRVSYWDSVDWLFSRGGQRIDAVCVGWFPIPKEDEDEATETR